MLVRKLANDASRVLVNRRDAESWPEDVLVQISESQTGRAIRTDRWKFGVVAPDSVSPRAAGSDTCHEHALYDLYADPYELTNLIHMGSHGGLCSRLSERLLARMAAIGEPTATIIPAEKYPSGQRRTGERDIVTS